MRQGSNACTVVIDGYIGATVAHARATDVRDGPNRCAHDTNVFRTRNV
jgi:hypothetical protein